MIYFDVTNTSCSRHHSGLTRTGVRLKDALLALDAGRIVEVRWSRRRGAFRRVEDGGPAAPGADDWFFTPELFSEEERPGMTKWLEATAGRKAAVFHDAIPIRLPEITWPRSVARHPYYMRLLGRFDTVLTNSAASARELREYWRWLGLDRPEPVAIGLGSDGQRIPRTSHDRGRASMSTLAMVGIVEPRKGQAAVLDAAERLWGEGRDFELVFIGRVNPHFGAATADRMRRLRRAGRTLRHEDGLDDAGVARVLEQSRFTLLPSLAEGCGLPVLESLWNGVPVLCSDVPALLETASGGGCRVVPAGDPEALLAGMRALLIDGAAVTRLAAEACSRQLPTWLDTARAVLAVLA